MNLVKFIYVNKMLLDYMNNNRKNFTTLMKFIDFLMFFYSFIKGKPKIQPSRTH